LSKKLSIILLFFLFTQALFAQANNYLRETSLRNNKLVLTFKYNIDNVKPLALESNGMVKYIYDIKNGVLSKNKKISHYRYKGIKAFRMGQYKKDYLRIVIESYGRSKKNYSIVGKVLTIYLNSSLSSKVSQSNKKKQNNKKYSKKKSKNKYTKKYHGKKTIIIDPGHGGRDVGAIGKGIYEKTITLEISKRLRKELQNRGYRVFMTRTYDKYLSLKERTEYANARAGNMFISIHANAAHKGKSKQKYQGVEVFHLSLKNSDRIKKNRAYYKGKYYYSVATYKRMTSAWKMDTSHKLAKNIRRGILSKVRKRYKLKDKGVKSSDFWVLLASTMPAVLIETGYLTHDAELRKLRSKRYQDTFSKGIADGVDAYFK
jgi:N-acetylmuramoyl-L-alanine amidase